MTCRRHWLAPTCPWQLSGRLLFSGHGFRAVCELPHQCKVSESNKTYVVTMDIINGRTGAVLGSNRERCETCGVEEAGEKMGLAASALRERLETVARAPAALL